MSDRLAPARAAKTAKARRADDALIRTVGVVEAILLARDEATARRRASVALGLPADPLDDGYSYGEPALVSQALAGWHKLRGAA